MKSTANRQVLPRSLKAALAKLGSDLNLARRKRALTIDMMVERIGASKATYLRVEKGDPSVSMGMYAMSLFALGLAEGLGNLADVSRDDTGLVLDTERVPKRVRPRRKATPL